MNYPHFEIELAEPLEWVTINNERDLQSCVRNGALHAVRKDGRVWAAFRDFCEEEEGTGLAGFVDVSAESRGPEGCFPFEVAMIRTAPWPLIYKDKDGWIDLELTRPELVGHTVYYELKGGWEGSAWGFLSYRIQDGNWRVRWDIVGGCGDPLPAPYDKPKKVRKVPYETIPKEWVGKVPGPESGKPINLEEELKTLKGKLKTREAEIGRLKTIVVDLKSRLGIALEALKGGNAE